MMEPRGVVSAAGYTPGITRGGVGSLFGSGFLDRDGVRVAASFPLPLALEATSVWVNGVAAPILAIGKAGQQEQINFQVPTSHLSAPAAAATMNNIIVRRGDALGFVFGFRMASPSSPIPGIFVDAAGQPAVTHADGSLLSSASPARPGERIVIFATGLGDVTPPSPDGTAAPANPPARTRLTPTVGIGGQIAAIEYSGLAPGFAGLYQVNAIVPEAPAGPQWLTLTVGGTQSKAETIYVGR